MKKRQWDNIILYNVNFLQLSYKKIRWSQLEKSWLASPGELQNWNLKFICLNEIGCLSLKYKWIGRSNIPVIRHLFVKEKATSDC